MDENKLKELKDNGYKINKCCGICQNGIFNNSDFGFCNIKTYEHLKHTDSTRQLSIYKFGICKNDFKLNVYFDTLGLQAWKQFIN